MCARDSPSSSAAFAGVTCRHVDTRTLPLLFPGPYSQPLAMSKLAAAGANALVKPYAHIERETEQLLNRQRKKGPEYKLNVDAKKKKEDEEYLRSILGELEGGGTAPRTGSPVKQPGSPKKGGEEGKKGVVGGGGGGMDAYDPKAVAQKELDELTEAVRGVGDLPPNFPPHPLFDGAGGCH